MKRLNVYLDGDLEKRFLADATKNKRGPQGEIEYLIEKALDALEAPMSGQAKELAAALEHNRQCRADCGIGDAPKRPRAKRFFNEVALAAAYHSGYESGVEDGLKQKGAAS